MYAGKYKYHYLCKYKVSLLKDFSALLWKIRPLHKLQQNEANYNKTLVSGIYKIWDIIFVLKGIF